MKHDGPVGISGPVISALPTGEDAVRLWDAVYGLLTNSKFFEVRRARSRPPEFPL
jgi:mycothiol-dependent nitroreductase-like protein